MRKFVVPTSSRLQKARDLDRKFVLMRDGVLALSMILPPERDPGPPEWLLVPMEGSDAWRTHVVGIDDVRHQPESLDLALDRVELGFDQVERAQFGAAPLGALAITPAGTCFVAEHVYRSRRRVLWLIQAELDGTEEVDEDSRGLIAKAWTLLGFRAGELVLEHQVTAIEAT